MSFNIITQNAILEKENLGYFSFSKIMVQYIKLNSYLSIIVKDYVGVSY